MKNVISFAAIAFSVFACQARNFGNEGKVTADMEVPMSATVKWENPQIDSTPLRKDASKPGLDEVGEGLTLVGSENKPINTIDLSKPIVIYIHGYTPMGDVPHNAFNEDWHKQFNTFYFRWHRMSYNPPPTPTYAWTKVDDATKLFINQFNKLYDAIGSSRYKQEIRLIGYSLGSFITIEGAQASTFSMASLTVSGKNNRRIDLLDPFLLNATNSRDFVNGVPVVGEENREKYERLYSSLAQTTASTIYLSSDIGRWLSGSSWRLSNVVKLASDWIGDNSDNLIDIQHTKIVPVYFDTLTQNEPVTPHGKKVITAHTPTADVRKQKLLFIQMKGMHTLTFADDEFQDLNYTCGAMHGLQFDNHQFKLNNGTNNFTNTVLNLVKICN